MPAFPVKTIAVIGAGCTGAMVAINLLKIHAAGGVKIILVDRDERMGRGLAYRTWDDNHVLNVPAGNMSALVDDPQHFVNFCKDIDPAFSAGSFVSRRLYGDYIEHSLAQAALSGGALLQRVQGEVTAVRPAPDSSQASGAEVELDNGTVWRADVVVLALGHLVPPDNLPSLPVEIQPFYVNNPWSQSALDNVPAHDNVLIVGTGHTAVDMLFSLTSKTDQRKVYMVSRKGLLSHSHRPQTLAPVPAGFPPYLDNIPATARQYFRAVRDAIRHAAGQGMDWRDIIAPLRPHTPAIWQRLPVVERSRFLRHAWTHWDIHRHRLAPSAYRRLHAMVARQQVEVIAGRILQYTQRAGGVDVSVRLRHGGARKTVSVKKIISCTGMNYDISKTDHRLFRQLLRDNLVRQDALKTGIDIAGNYAVKNVSGIPSRSVFYVGPMLRAHFLEAVGVPELREHARKVALSVSGVLSVSGAL